MSRSTTSSSVEFLLDWIAVQSSASAWFLLIWGSAGVLYTAVITWRNDPTVVPLTVYAILLVLVVSQGWLLGWVAAGIACRRRARLLLGGGLSLGAAVVWGGLAWSAASDALAAGMMGTWSLTAAMNGLLLVGTGIVRRGSRPLMT